MHRRVNGGPAAHVAPEPPHRSVRPGCSLVMSLVSAAALKLNLQEPDGWQAGLRSSGLQDESKKEINHRPSGDDDTRSESERVIQKNKAAPPPLHLRAAESETMWDKRGKLMRFWAGAKCNGPPWTFTMTSGRLDVITLNDFTAWVSY